MSEKRKLSPEEIEEAGCVIGVFTADLAAELVVLAYRLAKAECMCSSDAEPLEVVLAILDEAGIDIDDQPPN